LLRFEIGIAKPAGGRYQSEHISAANGANKFAMAAKR
jgi:hypothetical protein